MARPKIRVQHFLVCRGVEVEGPAGPDNPYTLRNVFYRHFVRPEIEFPTELRELWLFCRLVNLNRGVGTVGFAVEVVWMDSPRGEELICVYPGLAAYFREELGMVSRAWRLSHVPLMGLGGYEFRLRSAPNARLRAQEFVRIEQKR
jgi:hypothetical protein